jgi:hypothetical protein
LPFYGKLNEGWQMAYSEINLKFSFSQINHEQREKTDGEELIDFRDRSGSGSGRGRSGSRRWNKQQPQQSSHEGMIVNSRLQQQPHCSGVKTFGMCDCGMSRCIRVDPFTLKVSYKAKKEKLKV